jgi:outer membrane protein assembly factor BamA
VLLGGGVLSILMAEALAGPQCAQAQTATPPDPRADTTEAGDADAPAPVWRVVAEGDETTWPHHAPLDSARAVAARVLQTWRQRGYYYAAIDSVARDTAAVPPRGTVYLSPGPEVRVRKIRLRGNEALSTATLRAAMRSWTGRPLQPSRLEADIQAILSRYDAAGYPLAEVRVDSMRWVRAAEGEPGLVVTLRVKEGPRLRLARVETGEEVRTTGQFIARVAQLELGAPLRGYQPTAIRQRLRRTGLFESVGRPELRATPDGAGILYVPVTERPPGAFDLAAGYLPPQGGQPGRLVGNGRLTVENLFGGGRRLRVRLDRRPGRTSEVEAEVRDPFLFGLPINVEAGFEGEQRDSTFGTQRYRAAVGYRFADGLEVQGSLTQDVTQPGAAGRQIVDGTQRVPRSEGIFYGVGLRYDQLANPVNPASGWHLALDVERGQKRRRLRRLASPGDTTTVRRSDTQERIHLTGRFFQPTFRRQVVAVGLDGQALLSPSYALSDLYRFGGARSLRGYNEDRFLGHVVGRVLAEYRYRFDRRSYAYAFGDLGFVRTPPLRPDETARRGWHPGYGIGVQVETPLGLIDANYALNPSDRSVVGGRVHLKLSLGL